MYEREIYNNQYIKNYVNIQIIFVISSLKSKTTEKSCDRQLESASNLTNVR